MIPAAELRVGGVYTDGKANVWRRRVLSIADGWVRFRYILPDGAETSLKDRYPSGAFARWATARVETGEGT